ncbi:hypothetical protein D3C76_1407820 [compost metagenome]
MIGPQEHIEQFRHRAFVRGFVEAQSQLPTPKNAQVDLRGLGAFEDRGLGATDFQGQGVEEVLVEAVDALALKAGGKDAGQPVHALGDPFEPLRAVINRIETGDIGQQHLRGADVRVGLFTTNMLLAGLQRHAQGNVAAGIF